MKFIHKLMNMQNGNTIKHLTCDRESDCLL